MPRFRAVSAVSPVAVAAIVVIAAAGIGLVSATLRSGADAAAQEKKQDRETKVREDRKRVESAGKWIYDDLARGTDLAAKSGKPLLVVLRCIPCEACAKLDEDVVDRDPAVQALLDRFVCVRVPKANALDLATFQFDTDQSWAAFMLHADGTILGRYGTRSHRTDADQDVTLQGFAKSLEGALALHADFARAKPLLASKRGPAPEFASPELMPSLRGKYVARLDWEGKVVQSCIHCHMVGESQRRVFRDAGKAIPEEILFPYPNPTVLGLTMDPTERTRVKSVAPGSQAAKDGFRAGDEITTVEGQPVISTADIQWVLHHAKAPAQLAVEVKRAGAAVVLPVTLAEGWRSAGDITWRVSSWDLRRMVTGGTILEDADAATRRKARVADGAMALRVKHVGQYGDHAVAKKAGVCADDVVVAVDGKSDFTSETALIADLVARTKPGDVTKWTLVREGKQLDVEIRMQFDVEIRMQ